MPTIITRRNGQQFLLFEDYMVVTDFVSPCCGETMDLQVSYEMPADFDPYAEDL